MRRRWWWLGLVPAAAGVTGVLLASRAAARGEGRWIRFSGGIWRVKAHIGRGGPGPNYFADGPENVWVDAAGRLHLRITQEKGRWYCAEVICSRSLGYGTYRFEVETNTDALDPNVTLGMFLWDDDPAQEHREIDIECTRWGDPTDATNAQYVVQPAHRPGHRHRFRVSPAAQSVVHSFRWEPDRVLFRSIGRYPDETEVLLAEWEYVGAVPEPGRETPRINLWLHRGNPPINREPAEVVIRRFEFLPLAGALLP